MANVTVSDVAIWVKHIHGDPMLTKSIEALEAGQTVRLRIDGVSGAWRKMADGKDGRPTFGIRPLGEASDHWQKLFKERRKTVVAIELDALPERGSIALTPSPASDLERQAAVECLLSLAGQGWRSDEPYGARDENYDR